MGATIAEETETVATRSHGPSQLAAILVLVAVAAAACGAPPPPAAAPPPVVAPEEDEPEEPGPEPATPATAPAPLDFARAKRALARIYLEHGPRTDLYCGCPFAPRGQALVVDLDACGYVVAKDATRAGRVEWEHAVPASVFGKTFEAWTSGDAHCRSSRGKTFRGRACARKVSAAFARIEGDMHNLFPVVGEVNALRSDLPMGIGLLGDPSRPDPPGKPPRTVRFGACGTSLVAGALSPRAEVRGDLARAYKYMASAYPGRAPIDDAHRATFDAWDRDDPPDAWERERSALIARVQGTENPYVARALTR